MCLQTREQVLKTKVFGEDTEDVLGSADMIMGSINPTYGFCSRVTVTVANLKAAYQHLDRIWADGAVLYSTY